MAQQDTIRVGTSPHIKTGQDNPIREKRVPRAGKRVKDIPAHTVQTLTNTLT